MSFLFTEDGPICFKFATHMYGNGVGILRVKYRSDDKVNKEEQEGILWEMSGEAGNNWYIAQLPIASSSSFHIAFEGIVGPNYLGNIAIDSISLEQGECPSMLLILLFFSLLIKLIKGQYFFLKKTYRFKKLLKMFKTFKHQRLLNYKALYKVIVFFIHLHTLVTNELIFEKFFELILVLLLVFRH